MPSPDNGPLKPVAATDLSGFRRFSYTIYGGTTVEYLIPERLRYVGIDFAGRGPVGAPEREGPWEKLPPLLDEVE